MPKLIVFILLLLPFGCWAQFTITGKVLNQVDGKPVANASVFLSNATVGGKTADDGTFNLQNVKPGKYTLVISCIGFETSSQAAMVANANINIGDIAIFPKSIALKAVTIKPESDPYRSNYFFLFKERFLGTSDLAAQCKILNPQVLDFDYDKDNKTLKVTSQDFIEIENDALGYKIKYLLTNFTWDNRDTLNQKLAYEGPALFEPMKGTPAQQKKWQKKRREIYEGSEMHFFRAAIASRIDEEGFRVLRQAIYQNPDRPSDSLINAKIKYFKSQKATKTRWRDSLAYWNDKLESPKIYRTLTPFHLNKGDIIRPTDQRGLYALGCEFDGLYVIYDSQHNFPDPPKKMFLYNPKHIYNPNDLQASLISFNEPFAFIDRNGSIANPYSITINGRWVFNRVAELLPTDYEPAQTEDAHLDSAVYKNVTTKLNTFATQHTAEKVYLHFDKPYYAAGDTMYFKAYLTSGENHQLSSISGVVHVDLIGTDNKILRTINLEAKNGLAWGDFTLPDSLKNGGYRIRAYTNIMRNDGNHGYFDQLITIGSLGEKTASTVAVTKPQEGAKPDIQFFPEGGNLVTNVTTKVAYKAIDANGGAINVKGEVIDNDGKVVSTFTSSHLGMGYFDLSPEEGKTYKAKITFRDGSKSLIDLPKAYDKGIALIVDNDSLTTVSIKIDANPAYFKENRNKDYTLVVYANGTAKTMICKLDNTSVKVDLLKRWFSSGVARVTLFSPAGEPLAERLFFIQNFDQLNLDIRSDKKAYAKREKTDIRLNSTTSSGDVSTGHFSVSVIDENKLPVDENSEHTILTDLLLTSDLKGYIEQPNYYFANTTDSTRRNLDLVMLTHGYRRFEWKQVLDTTKLKTNYQPENSLEIAGTIKTRSGKPVPHGSVTLLSTRENVAMDTTTDVNGNFKFTGLTLSDTAKVVLNARKSANGSANVKVEVNAPDYPTVEPMNITPSDTSGFARVINESINRQYQQRKNLKNGIVLKQVNIKSAAKTNIRPELKHSSNLNGPGQADYVLLGDKLTGCPTLLECLIGKIPGVRFQGSTPTIYSVRTTIELQGATPPMVVILDGVINSQEVLTTINPDDVASIEVLESRTYLSIYSAAASGGALIINTKVGSEKTATTEVEPGVVTYQFNGFYKARKFYSPKYDHPVADNAAPDLRTTIFWKPEVATDEAGNASFDYYNADTPGTYRVVVEGIDGEGNIGRQVYRYKVK